MKVKVIRKISIKGKDNITIHSDVLEEEVTEKEYRKIYDTRVNKLAEIKELISQAKDVLKEISTIEETPELKKFTGMLIKVLPKDVSDRMKNKEKTIENLKKMEIEAKQQEIELEQFTPAMKKLQK